ncbi:hypothetical protein T11_16472 [Trichinella zimbabwensis]|uniref:Uncharacterized protein n=1 Tax=Trichinella zimbabwensis TaxID=268475 RepID=A0A0V1F318_9BILA|nr:hypothetical protein T11_16472 [Trichinella zimbabwensis]
MHQMEHVCFRLLKIFNQLKDSHGELGPDGVGFPGIGS